MTEKIEIKDLSLNQLMEFPFETGGVIVNFSQNNIGRAGETHILQPKVMELLILLCCAQGETLTKQALITALWPDTIVGPDSLANSMARLRKALGDDAKNPKFIQTIQRKGYRWLQPIVLSNPLFNEPAKVSLKSKYFSLLLLVCICIAATIFFTSFLSKDEPESFLFPDLSIKKLADGGYEIQAGIEGELTEEKKAAMLKEIKRITGEENSGMEFTIDPLKSDCQQLDSKDKNENITDCEASLKKKH